MATISYERMLVDNGQGPEYDTVRVYRYEDHYRPGTYGPPQRDLTPYEANELAKHINAFCRGASN